MSNSEDGVAKILPLRILEINSVLFRRAVPEQTEFYWADRKARAKPLLGPLTFFRLLRRLRAGEFDLVVIAPNALPSWHPRSFLTALREWHVQAPTAIFATIAAPLLQRLHTTPIAVVDMRDTFRIAPHMFGLLDRCHTFFKRELPVDRWQAFFKSTHWDLPGRRWRSKKSSQRRVQKLAPISLGTAKETPHLDILPEKTSDVFFAGDLFPNSTVRSEGIAELKALRDEGYRIDVPEERLSRAEFFQRLASAHLAWSPAGYGWDCFRHYEAPLLHTVPLINYPTVARYAPFIDGKHCLFYPVEPGGLAAVIRAALLDKEQLKRIATDAAAFVTRHHSAWAQAEHVAITVLGRRLDGSAVEPALRHIP